MAAYLCLQGRGVASLGKRFVSRINYPITRDSPLSPTCCLSRAVHVSAYDKNPEDQTAPTVVPDSVIQPQSEKYWTPHPQTGVFGPSVEQNPPARGEGGFPASAATVTEDSVLEQKAFFRPLEDLEKPPPQP